MVSMRAADICRSRAAQSKIATTRSLGAILGGGEIKFSTVINRRGRRGRPAVPVSEIAGADELRRQAFVVS